jgi:hypothetical protein
MLSKSIGFPLQARIGDTPRHVLPRNKAVHRNCCVLAGRRLGGAIGTVTARV